MPDLATAFADAKMISQQRANERSDESRARARARATIYNAPRGLVRGDVVIGDVDEESTVHCFDPWLIARAEPNREHAAYKSLRREGFETWFPAGRKIKQLPQRFISSKTRHKKKNMVLEDLRLPYPGYVFFRRMTSQSQGYDVVGRLYELDGLIGLCMFGESIAIAEDYEIQMLRFKEDIGSFDVWDIQMSAKEFGLADIRRTEAAKDRWSTAPKVLGKLDTNQGRGLYLVEAFGRITRVVAAAGDLTVPALR